MKRTLVVLAFALVACQPPETNVVPTIKLEQGTSSLDVSVLNVKVGKGKVYCALHVAEDTFPGASPVIDGTVEASPDASTVKCVYSKLPAGTFAVSSYQDENSNGKLDTNAFGAPTEGYGASKNVLPAAAPPTFDDNKLTLTDGQTLTVEMKLR